MLHDFPIAITKRQNLFPIDPFIKAVMPKKIRIIIFAQFSFLRGNEGKPKTTSNKLSKPSRAIYYLIYSLFTSLILSDKASTETYADKVTLYDNTYIKGN